MTGSLSQDSQQHNLRSTKDFVIQSLKPASTMSTKPPPKIGIIIGSTREPRVGPQITTFITSTLQLQLQPSPASPPIAELSLIDLSHDPLPMFNEPTVPQRITHFSQYVQPHTQAWSQLISSHDAFIFVTPQYNWGYPASLKNAIDYLFNEWKGKPAMIVSYGGHGGGRAAAQLRVVLEGGLDMKVVGPMPGLAFEGKEMLVRAAKGEDLRLKEGAWKAEMVEVVKGFEEIVGILEKK